MTHDMDGGAEDRGSRGAQADKASIPDSVLDTAVAVVGMSARVPGARDPETFWGNLRAGVESVQDLTREELEARGVDPRLLADPAYVLRASALEGAGEWDAGFWGFSPREAAVMDPQIRHFIELCWEGMENAGYAPGTFAGPVGVFGGCGPNTYMMFQILGDPDILRDMGFFLVRHIGNDKDFLVTRASYHLNLTGPGVGVQTACSTSLTAIHLAVQSLLAFECDMALAGGVTITFPHRLGYRFLEGEILSSDGTCRAFDVDSEGTVLGDGGAVVVLRRLRDALDDGDTIHAVIRGSAVNNDGSAKVGYLAPSVEGQARVVTEALAVADVSADTIGYVEAHGTGTRVGDPIEVAALTKAYRAHTQRKGYCWLGSVKTNIGHLDTAAGVAGFLKAALAVRDGVIPPSLHFQAPNPGLALESSPFRIPTEAVSFPEASHPRRAAVSSLGVGGTNVHVVLEAPPEAEPSAPDPRSRHLVVLSARNGPALERASARLVDHLEGEMEREARGEAVPSLADTAWTLQAGRARLKVARILVGRTREELVDTLVTGDPQRMEEHESDEEARSTTFLFAGGGAQYAGMARDLWEHEPRYRDEVENLLRHLREGMGETALHQRVAGLLGLHGAPPLPEDEQARPSVGLPALFVVQLAQARLWISWGITPSAMIGHSMGEYSAAVVAGVLRAEEALELVVLRGRLFERVERGAMLSVPLSEDALRRLLDEVSGGDGDAGTLSVAAVNGPELTVASGPVGAIEALQEELERRGVEGRRIHIDVAAHSHMLEPILAPFRERLRQARLAPPVLPFVSNLTGRWITAAEATDPEYWVRQLRETVRFSDGLERLFEDPSQVLLEVGPGRTLATLARLHPGRPIEQEIFTSIRHPEESVEDDHVMLQVLGRLWQRGVAVDWAGVHAGARRRRVPLPTYPFERDIHMVEPKFRLDAQADPRLVPGWAGSGTAGSSSTHAREGEGPGDPRPVAEWLHRVRWVPLASTGEQDGAEADPADEAHLRVSVMGAEDEDEAPRVSPGTSALLLEAGIQTGPLPDHGLPRILVTDALEWGGGRAGADGLAGAREPVKLLLRLLEVGKRVAERVTDGTWEAGPHGEPAAELVILTRGATDGTGDPAGALAAGPARVLAAETPGLITRWIDLPVETAPAGVPEPRVGALLREALCLPVPPEGSQVVAIRGGKLLEPAYASAAEVSSPADDPALGPMQGAVDVLPRGAVCVISGGYGGVGLEVARHLARTRGARLVLLGRTALPDPGLERVGTAPEEAQDAGLDPRVLRAMRVVRELRAEGAEVLPLVADVTDEMALEAARDRIIEAFGTVDAIFHAAGVLDDGLALLKEPASAARVLGPKVTGTLLLDRVFGGPVAPKVVVLFSSVSAEAGLPGQVDYAAANSFLDAWARWKDARRGGEAGENAMAEPTRWVSVGWSAWAETGMAVDAGRGLVAWPPLPGVQGAHGPWARARSPLFDAVDRDEGRARVRLRAGRLWMLDEHRTADGLPLIPGAGYLELIWGALREMEPRGEGEGHTSGRSGGSGNPGVDTSLAAAPAFALEELYFVAPFFVPDGATRELEVRLTKQDGVMRTGGEVSVVGRSAPDEPWTEHVRARLGVAPAGPESGGAENPARIDPRSPTLDFDAPPVPRAGGVVRQDLALGPRWSNVRGMASLSLAAEVAENESAFEGMVELALELPPAYGADLAVHPLHAALLDNATALAGPLLPGFGEAGSVYVPASYGRFVVHRAFPGRRGAAGYGAGEDGAGSARPRIRSWIGRTDVSGSMVTLQVRITDEEGTLLAEAQDFVMVQLSAEELEKGARAVLVAEAARRQTVADAAAQGLPTATGLQVLEAALRPSAPPHLLVTAGDPAERVARLREAAATRGRPRGGREGKEGPDVNVAPVEAALAELEALREAAVTAHEDRPGEVRLVAHVVMDPERFATVSEIRRGLRAVLPRELVPRNFVQLDALPRTRRGAVDRKALHDPFSPVDRHIPPSTPSQGAVARVWGDILGSDRVGIHDNFLDIGGHSLLAMRAIMRIEKETGYRIGQVEINLMTLEQIAARIDEAMPASAPASGPDTGSSGPKDALKSAGSEFETDASPHDLGERGGILKGLRRFIPGG